MANITNRDLALLKRIAELGMLSSKQVGHYFFEGVNMTTVLRRLRKLEAAHLLRRMMGPTTLENFWILTNKGGKVASVEVFKTNWSKNMIEHDSQLISLRLVLEQVGIAHSWIPEHEIRSLVFRKYGLQKIKNKLVPDGLIGVEVNNKMESVAIELELTLKDTKRYRKIMNLYQDKKDLYAVWYIVPTHALLKSLKETWKRYYGSYSQVKVYFSHLGELITNPLEAKLIGFNSIVKISELFVPLAYLPAHVPAHGVSTLEDNNFLKNRELTSEIHTPISGLKN